MNDVPPFVVLKFLSEDPDEPEDEIYEVAYSGWLQQEASQLQNKCLWPPSSYTSKQISEMVKKQVQAPTDGSWKAWQCEIQKFYGNYLNAHLGAQRRIKDPTYETEKELGRGLRKRIIRKMSDSDDDEPPSKLVTDIRPPSIDLGQTKKSFKLGKKHTVKSPLNIISRKDENRQENYTNILNKVRKSRGTEVSTTEDLLAKLRERKRQGRDKQASGKKNVELTASQNGAQDSTSEASTSQNWRTLSVTKMVEESRKKMPVCTFWPLSDRSVHEVRPNSSASSDENVSSALSMNLVDIDYGANNEENWSVDLENSVTKLSESSSNVQQVAKKTSLSDFQRDVLIALKEINEKVETISSNQTKLLLFLLPNEKVISRPKGLPTLPLKSVDEILKMERYLEEDEKNLCATSIYLSTCVSKKPELEKQSAMKLMAQLLSNNVATKYNFKGLGNKLGFESLLLWKAVQGAVVLKVENTDLSQTVRGVKDWLKDAPWRDKENSSHHKRSSGTEHKNFQSKGKQ